MRIFLFGSLLSVAAREGLGPFVRPKGCGQCPHLAAEPKRRVHNVHALALGHRSDVGGGEYDPEPGTGPGLVAKVPAVGGWGSGWLGF